MKCDICGREFDRGRSMSAHMAAHVRRGEAIKKKTLLFRKGGRERFFFVSYHPTGKRRIEP